MEYFAGIRVKGKLDEVGKWIPSDPTTEEDYVDMMISESEAERIVAFLSESLRKEKESRR